MKMRIRVAILVKISLVLFILYLVTENYIVSFYNLYSSNGSRPRVLQFIGSSGGFLVHSPSCTIPDVNPWHESILPFVYKDSPPICTTKPPLTKVKDSRLILSSHLASVYSSHLPLKCCYQRVERTENFIFYSKTDISYGLSECQPFKNNVTLTSAEEFLVVKCFDSKNLEIYRDFHLVLSVKDEVLNKIEKHKGIDRLNVLIVGVDSVSRLNMHRTMPKAIEFMKKEGWLEMLGYNKIDDNTLPNFSAMLTGLTHESLVSRPGCQNVRTQPFDNCSFIWKEYSAEGFITAYAEESASISTFNNYNFGFFKAPTDYYPRPFFLAAEELSGSFDRNDVHMCLGSKLAVDHILNFSNDFSGRFNNNKFFGFFWLNSLSHSYLNLPSTLDEKFLELFKLWKTKNVLKNTFVVFLSDHGRRFGDITKTDIGWLEERLPFLFIWVPESYKKMYPEKYSNLEQNINKLLSPFDLHLTLKDILYRSQQQGTTSCPRCVSMFAEVPSDRSCEDAAIPQHWCACTQYQKIPSDSPIVKNAISFILLELNTQLHKGKRWLKPNQQCASLSLKKVEFAKQSVDKKIGEGRQLLISFWTTPESALLQATVGEHAGRFQLLGTVSRLNSYGKQSWCIDEPELQKYCICI